MMNDGRRGRLSVSPSARATTLLAVALAGCESNPVEPTIEERLIGSWEWVRAEGGIAGRVITPQTEGFTLRLVIEPSDRVELFRDERSERATLYELLPAPDLGDERQGPRIRYTEPLFGFDEQGVGFDREGRLVLRDPCCDGFVYTWRRIADAD